MNADDPNPEREEVHRGHDLEAGLLARVREWTDVLPWLRLGRTLRVAGSPPHVLLIAVVFSVWWLGQSLILGDHFTRNPILQMRLDASSLSDLAAQSTSMIATHIHGSTSTSIFDFGTRLPWWRG